MTPAFDPSPHRTRTAWLMLSPALALMGVFVFFPMVYELYLSFTAGSFTRNGVHWVGWANYARLVADPDFWQVVGNTVYFTGVTVGLSMVLPLLLAVALNDLTDRVTGRTGGLAIALRDLLRTAYFIPSVTSLVAAGLGFRWLFQPEGPVNQGLQWLGWNPIPWLSSPIWAMPVLIGLSSWTQLGFNMVVFLAGLQMIPPALYEAAQMDGANRWVMFWRITLPSLRPTLLFVGVTTTLFTLRSFEQPYVITGGGPLNSTNLLVFYIYQQAFAQFDIGYAAAAATLLLGVAIALVYVQLKVTDS